MPDASCSSRRRREQREKPLLFLYRDPLLGEPSGGEISGG